MPHTAPADDPLLTPRQVADRLGVDLSTLRGWAGKGTGPERIFLGPQTVRYRSSALESWLDARAASSRRPVPDRMSGPGGGAP